MSLPLPKLALIAAALISIVVAGGVGGTWEYASIAVNDLQIVCNIVTISSPSNVTVIVGVKNPSLVTVDGTWGFLFEGVNGTTPWSSGSTVSFHIPAGSKSILDIKFPGLAGHINSSPTHGALTVNVTLYVSTTSYHVGMRTFNGSGSITNATVEIPFSQGKWNYC